MDTEKQTAENTEKRAAEVLLDRGVSWPVQAPWFLRIFGKKKVRLSVRALKLGTLLELSLLYAEMGIDPEDMKNNPHELIRKHLKTVCRITALCILNSEVKIKLFTKPLARYIRWAFTGNMLFEVMFFIITYSAVKSFSNTIRLIGDLSMTAPKNLSPKDQGSQQK
jgi:hypothetical protein